MQIILNSIEELKDICSLIGGTKFIAEPEQSASVKVEKQKEEVKAEKVKKDKVASVEDKKEETKIDAEVTGVDTSSNEPTKDAEITEENSDGEEVKITKEMVRAICSKAIKVGKSAEVKNIVSKYGASKLPDLKEESYADAYKDVEALL